MFIPSANLISPPDEFSGRFLQSPVWAEFKSRHGWNALYFKVQISEGLCFDCSVLRRQFFRFFSLAYIPLGPDIDSMQKLLEDEDGFCRRYKIILQEFSRALVPHLPKNTLCLRIDPPIEFSVREKRDSCRKNFKTSPVDIQPPDTSILNLVRTSEELFEQMKPKWRYNIRLAEKKAVTVHRGGLSDIDIFYALYKETAKRDGIVIHSKKYYEDVLKMEGGNIQARLYIAVHEGDALAAIICLFSPKEAVYLYGASSNNKRNLMPSYLLQWQAIQDAKAFGAQIYDFFGIPPTDDEKHPMHGLYRFKTGFGGQNIHRLGSLDIPLSIFYVPYRLTEYMRYFYYKKLKKIFSGR